MSNRTGIEWADATWNPVVGCSPCSPGCDNCYAARMAHRLGANPATPQHAGLTTDRRYNGTVRLVESVLEQLARYGNKPRRIFVCSMGDLFHSSLPDRDAMRVLDAMAAAPQHTYLLLTKRPVNMRDSLSLWTRLRHAEEYGHAPIPRNWWVGVTVCNQQEADEKIPVLLDIPAAVRFVSVEPMLGPVDLREYLPGDWWCPTCQAYLCGQQVTNDEHHETCGTPLEGRIIDWVICGGETGPRARKVDPRWVVDIYEQCQLVGNHYQCHAPGVPFFAKRFMHIGGDATGWTRNDSQRLFAAIGTREFPKVADGDRRADIHPV